MSRRTVKLILGVLGLLIIGWDVLLYLDAVEGNTISRVVLGLPDIVDFLAGVICGHLFWPQDLGAYKKIEQVYAFTETMLHEHTSGGRTAKAYAERIREIIDLE